MRLLKLFASAVTVEVTVVAVKVAVVATVPLLLVPVPVVGPEVSPSLFTEARSRAIDPAPEVAWW